MSQAPSISRDISVRKARLAPEPAIILISRWLDLGWRSLNENRFISVLYGAGLFFMSWAILMTVWYFNLTWSLIPLLAGGMLVGPVAAVGLYGVVRRGTTSVGTSGQVVLVGAILMIVALIWIRAATLLFAVFYGLQPFPGFSGLLIQMFTTPQGLLLLLVGSGVGGLFAAFTFAISAFSIPMLVDRPIDAFSAMALSFNAVTHNFTLAVLWGAVLTGMALVSIMTGLLGIVLVFPWLGYATWHAYCDLFEVPNDV